MSLRSQEPPCSCCWSPPVHRYPRGTAKLFQQARGKGTRWKPDLHLGGVGPGTCLCQLLAGPPGGPCARSQDAPAQNANYGFHKEEAGDLIHSIPEHPRCPSVRSLHLGPGEEYLAYLPSPTSQCLRLWLSHFSLLKASSYILHVALQPLRCCAAQPQSSSHLCNLLGPTNSWVCFSTCETHIPNASTCAP